MRRILAVICVGLYTLLTLGANGVVANTIEEMRIGAMKKLNFHASPQDLPNIGLLTLDDTPASLADYRGRWVVLNFWATWCAPCRAEMPSLDALQASLPEITVLPIATGRNQPTAITRFYEEAALKNLPILRDPKAELSRAMSVLALPVTVILNPEGQEVARLIGDADWNSESAQQILRALQNGMTP